LHSQETLRLQEESPEDFKEFTMTGKLLEGIANGKAGEEIKEGEEYARFYSVLKESKYQKNLTFTIYKVLKNALLKK
jgi:hypothetical protein